MKRMWPYLAVIAVICLMCLFIGCKRDSAQSTDQSTLSGDAASAPSDTTPPPTMAVVEEEPPFDLPAGNSEGLARETKLLEFSNGKIIYQITYPGNGLVSKAYLESSSMALEKEIFAGKWVVIYGYKDATFKYSQAASEITIYKDAGGGQKGKLINHYKFVDFVSQKGVKYKGDDGHELLVEFTYMAIASRPGM